MYCQFCRNLFIFGDASNNIAVSGCCVLPASCVLNIDIFNKLNLKELSNMRNVNRLNSLNRLKSINCEKPCVFEDVEDITINALLFCNINCYNCVATTKTHKPNLHILSIILNKTLEFKGLKTIILDGSGEIFTVFNYLIKYLKKLNKEITNSIMFITNATLLSKEKLDILKDISNSTGVEYKFNVSIDGITKETYESIRIGANFEKVIENLKNIKNIFSTSVSYTIKKPNMNEDLDNVKLFFKDIGINYVGITADCFDIASQQKLITFNKRN
ncbi:MAG: radical SAM protein [Clostridia bacterium]|nr:radical SAM protein [Clostridia bacterium]